MVDNLARQSPPARLGGIPLVAHDHLCVFYRGQAERQRLLLPFLAEGLASGDAVFYLAAEGEKETISSQLGAQGDLELAEPEGGHLRDGRFAPKELLAAAEAWADRKLAHRDRPFGRIAGDMSWAKPMLSPELIDMLVAEEVSVTALVRRHPQVALCLYDLNLFGGDLIIPMIKAHPKVWIAGTLIENPYHTTPSGDPLDGDTPA